MYNDISCIVLAGGKSLRMGSNKALLKLGSETIIERIISLAKSLFKNILLITNTPSEYKFLNLPIHEDIYKQKGPLSGIHSGLFYSATEINLIISCDLPLISSEMIRYIVEFKSNKLIKYCIAGRHHQPLVGIYSRSILPEIEKIFLLNEKSSGEKGKIFSIKNLINKVDAEVINPEGLSFYNDDLFFNLNFPENFEYLKRYKNIKV